jgi:hypothetical protein
MAPRAKPCTEMRQAIGGPMSALDLFCPAERAGRPALLVAFDLLYLNGRDLRKTSLIQRKAELKKIIAGTDIQFSESFEIDGQVMFAHACKLVPGLIQNDEELFSDMIGAFHSFNVQHALKQPFQAQLVVLAVILSFMDAYAVTDPRSGRSTLSGLRFSLLIEHFESLGGEYAKAAEELMLMRCDLDAIFWPSLAVARKLVDELGAAAERNRKMPTWYLRSSDYIVRKNVIEE